MTNTDELAAFYRNRVDSYADVPAGFRAQWRELCRLLQSRGGRLVVPPLEPELSVAQLLTIEPREYPAKMQAGRPRDCHANAAELWVAGDAHTIGTGYALSEDGLWRQHSWALTGSAGDVTLLETTTPRVRYHGLEHTGVEALRFAYQNAPDAVHEAADEDPHPGNAQLWVALAQAASL